MSANQDAALAAPAAPAVAAPNTPAPAVVEGPRIITVLGQEAPKVAEPASAPAESKEAPTQAAAAGLEEKTPSADGEADSSQERDERGKFKPGVQKRIDELTRQRHDAEREAAYWKGLAEGKGGEPAKPAAPAPKAAPIREQFATDEAFQDAMVDHKVDQKLQQRDVQRKQTEEATTKATSWQQKIDAAKAEIPDFDTVMESAELPVAGHVAELLMEHDSGAKIVHFLASNPAALEKMNGMTPAKAAFEIAGIAAKFQTAEASASAPAASGEPSASSKPAAERAVSKAPPPAASNVGAGRATTPKLEDLSMEDYVSQRRAQGASWAR